MFSTIPPGCREGMSDVRPVHYFRDGLVFNEKQKYFQLATKTLARKDRNGSNQHMPVLSFPLAAEENRMRCEPGILQISHKAETRQPIMREAFTVLTPTRFHVMAVKRAQALMSGTDGDAKKSKW